MKKTPKRVLALLLALTLLALLCACAKKADKPSNEEPEVSAETLTKPEPAQDAPAAARAERDADESPEDAAGDAPGDAPGPSLQLSREGAQSLLWLRDRIDLEGVMFGVAYLGYVGGLFDEGFEAGFPAWLWETNEAMLLKYPFIAEIDEEHIIGGAGHLYCIVPVDENATLAINRVQWNSETWTDEVTEVLYRSESGEPVLLFANLDGVAYEADTQVFITDNNGNTCEWYPSLDANTRVAPCYATDGMNRSFDFTEYTWQNVPSYLADRLSAGWSGMTALGLAGSQGDGMGWITETTAWETDRNAFFSLRFYLDDETGGSVVLNWGYEDEMDFEEMWSGFWTIQTVLDGPSYVTLSLSLVGGNSYETSDGPFYMSETYPFLISPSGTELLVGAGESGICLPFMSQSTTACVLTQAAG